MPFVSRRGIIATSICSAYAQYRCAYHTYVFARTLRACSFKKAYHVQGFVSLPLLVVGFKFSAAKFLLGTDSCWAAAPWHTGPQRVSEKVRARGGAASAQHQPPSLTIGTNTHTHTTQHYRAKIANLHFAAHVPAHPFKIMLRISGAGRCPYEVLNIPLDATQCQIKKVRQR
jgi:hypothetical protein